MPDRYPLVFLSLAGLVFIATGLTFVFAPGLVPAIRQSPHPTPDALNDARAIYGAMELAYGAFLAACATHPRHYEGGYRAAIALGAAAALSRFVGFVVVAGTPAAHLAYGALDLVGAVFGFIGLRRLARAGASAAAPLG